MRMCIGCRSRRKKTEMVRFIRTPEGSLMRADKKKAGGRGLYLCPDPRCFKKAEKKDRRGRLSGMQDSGLFVDRELSKPLVDGD